MVCPKCNVVAKIGATRYVTEGDNDPKTETKLFIEQQFVCRNPQCIECGKIIGTKRNRLKVEND